MSTRHSSLCPLPYSAFASARQKHPRMEGPVDVPFLNEIIILFLLSILVNTACSRLRLPATVGFLLTGILCGPTVLGVVSDAHSVDVLAELGVALLLFTIGMELSGEALSRLKKPVFLGGSLQICLTIACIALLVGFRDDKWSYGIFMGCLVALSSSAIVLRLLQEKGATNTPHGRLSLAILVFQDIMVAPMLLVVPLLAGTVTFSPQSLLLTLGKIALMLGGVLLFARFGLERLMAAVVRTRVRELLLLTTLGLCMGLALLTASLGLSLSLGAFLAGLLLARSEYSMSVVSGVLPYRDVFMSLFFISVGMLLNVDYVLQHPVQVVLQTLMFICIKALLTLPAVLVQKYPLRTAIIVALSLAQVGEFSFVLAASGLKAGLLEQQTYQGFLAMSILTMMLTPALMHVAPGLSATVARLLGRSVRQEEEEEGGTPTSHHSNHLIIVGFGVSGKHLARAARESGIKYEILEMNPDTVARFKDQEPIHYGDASQPAVLEHLGIKRARVLAIVISDPAAVRATIAEASSLNPGLHIVARTRFLGEVAPLRQLGATDVIAEEFESSMEVFARVLNQYLVPKQDIDAFSARIRAENYSMFRSVAENNGTLERLMENMPDVGMQSLRLEEESPLCGKNLMESELRREYGITVVAVNREGDMHPSPDGTFTLHSGDVLHVFGTQDSLQKVAHFFPAKAEELF